MHASTDGKHQVQGMMTYYDIRLGRTRLKRRYVWACYGFAAGILLGAVIGWIL
jgi:hypothetical protein